MELSYDPGVSEKQNTWLDGLCSNEYPNLHYAIKNGEQDICLKRLKVDGFSPFTDTAFEFDGCYFCVKPSLSKSANEKAIFLEEMEEKNKKTLKNVFT